MQTGSCECGAVAFETHGPLRAVSACHCTQCRKTSGHYWAATAVAKDKLVMTREDGLVWYQSSDAARRGFCKNCGSSVFYDRAGRDIISIGAGTLDGDAEIVLERHIFCADKGAYYEINDDVPQLDAY